VAATLTGTDAPVALRAGARVAAVPPTAVASQTSADTQTAGLTEIAAFVTGTMVTMGSRPLSETSVSAAGDLPSLRPTTSSELR
jgi:hypothetical protein